jgi:hypothetical protein
MSNRFCAFVPSLVGFRTKLENCEKKKHLI